jgi:outer membrane protein OmpA-like peptidoglycan-associated protein
LSRKETTEESYQVPIWVITFSDMTTNLLTFFVLLLSMGHMRDETLFDQGQTLTYLESVRRGFGLKEKFDFGNIKIKHHVSEEGDLLEGRTIDAREEDIRRIFTKLRQHLKETSSPIVAPDTSFLVTGIHFGQGQASLNEQAQSFLRRFASQVQESADSQEDKLYVLGLAYDAVTEQEQWILSAKRAQTVADFLRDTLSAAGGGQTRRSMTGGESKWSVYSWGAGPGGDWVERDSPISKHSQILIAVLRASD